MKSGPNIGSRDSGVPLRFRPDPSRVGLQRGPAVATMVTGRDIISSILQMLVMLILLSLRVPLCNRGRGCSQILTKKCFCVQEYSRHQ